ncbi:hypothetical protein BTO18_03020 [Polaribacter porphyrae]|uniref:Translocation and assembly module TamB C-terminal domain-containing protein n=1 Tax=Polaribacter porphyrae TaxID=1137780 RepID=A0A2S7WU80_9FLAO|nr:translocation/assembly module TamB domain-containing protein [Polaribacter porphyrae]PQJ80881.1 hypothetical protein BTO18_03020 [Polaribacter porphyrae]
MAYQKNKKRRFRFLRRTLRVFVGIITFLILLVLFVKSPWGQNIIINQITSYISKKTNTKIAIDKAFITFDGSVKIDGLFLEDKKGDTLVYSKSLKANLPLWGLINGTALGVDDVKWNGLRANIIRKDTVSGYNFQFLIDALAPQKTDTIVKDTISKSPEIIIGNLDLTNVHVVYNDIPLGIESSYKVNQLKTSMKKVDAENMVFKTNDLLLTDANIKYIQKPVLVVSDEEILLPNLSAENITVKNTKFYYEATESNLITDLNLLDFSSENPQLNLEEGVFNIDDITLKKSTITVKTETVKNQNRKKQNSEFFLPDLLLKIGGVNLENNKINYIVDNQIVRNDILNPNALAFQNVNLIASDISYENKKAALNLSTFNFSESSGLDLQKLTFKGSFSNSKLDINKLQFLSEGNSIAGNFEMFYNSLQQLIVNPEVAKVKLNLPTINLNLNRLLRFQPSLKKNSYIKELSKKPIVGSVFANGNLANINLYNSKINWGKTTEIALDGTIKNATNMDKLKLNLPEIKAKTTRNDILKFINEDSLGIKLPKEILLTGSINGSLKDIKTDLKLKSSQGTIVVNGNLTNTDKINFDATISIKDYQLNELLKNDKLGTATINIKSKGNGKTLNDLDATLNVTVSELKLNNYAIKDLQLNGDFKNGIGNLKSKYKDSNLNIKLDAFVDLDTVNTKANATINVIGADLEALGLMQRKVKTGMDITLGFKGNATNYTVDADVKNGAVVYDNKTYLLGGINVNGFIDKDTTAVSFKNKTIDLKLASNTDPARFSKALEQHIFSYFYRDEIISDTIKNPVNLTFRGKIAQTPLLEEVFLVNIKDIDTIDIAVDFNQKKRKLNAKITAPHINYSGNEIDSLSFTMNTNKDDFNFRLGFKDIKANPLDVPKTVITGNQKNNELSLNFKGIHKDELMMNVNTKITGNRDLLKFTVASDSLFLNKHSWAIPENNQIEFIDNNQLKFTNFKITKGNQSIEITDELDTSEIKDFSKDHIAIKYNNFQVKEVFNYLNPEKEIATGILNGTFILEDPFQNTGVIADLNVKNLKFLKTDFGKLSLQGKSLGNGKYDFGAKLKEGDVDLDLTGDYLVANEEAFLNLDLNINEFKMKALNTLSMGELKDTSGSFSGNFNVDGTLSAPKYNGDISFDNANFNITKLNTKFTLLNEKLKVNNQGLFMNNFTVLDAKKNKLILKGNIKTKSFINPKFNLQLKANNFRLLNASKKDNPNLYGTATFNANADLTGDLQIPKLTANVTLGKDTNVTYVLPATYANIENRDEVVAFVNRENPNAILTQTEEQTAIISGFDIFTKLKIDKQAAITVVINEDTGDNFKVSGDGDFIFNMIPNGRISLTGAYEIANGHYELNLYGLVNRKFYLAPGGRISWSGDPFDAKLDASAIYNIKTSASPLMAAQISDEDPSIKNKFKQVLPFNVYLNIDGELMQPKISFNLDMPEDEQGAIGGQVYGRVQQVNQQEEELNKQVFSLLVLNRFYPDSGSDGSLGGFSTIARDNLNDAVSGQLNAFSDKILGNSGIELNFDLNSYTDYQGTAATDRTQLGVTAQKKLFDDRLTVRVGSDVDLQGSNPTGEQTPLIGNVSLEYKLSKDGRYRLKGFRRSQFENVIDGQTIVSGVALIFMQEFNEFRELWNAIFRAQKEIDEEREKTKAKLEAKEEATEEETDKSIEKKKN